MSEYKIYLKLKPLFFIVIIIQFLFYLSSCGIYRKTDARKVSPNADERVQQNLEEGRGFRLLKKNKSGNFDFATSNELWRAWEAERAEDLKGFPTMPSAKLK